jgi:hypothetical protein
MILTSSPISPCSKFIPKSLRLIVIDAFGYYDIVVYMGNILMTLGCGVILTQAAAAGPANARLEQRAQSFTIVLLGSVADVTPLFGPVREAEWAPVGRLVSFIPQTVVNVTGPCS